MITLLVVWVIGVVATFVGLNLYIGWSDDEADAGSTALLAFAWPVSMLIGAAYYAAHALRRMGKAARESRHV